LCGSRTRLVWTRAGARSAWGRWLRICGAGAGRWRVGGGRSARRLTGPRGSVRWKRGCARSAGGTEVGKRDDLLQHRCDSQELLDLVRPDGWPHVLEHDAPQARDIVFLVARGGECRQQAGGTDQRRHLAGARAASLTSTCQAPVQSAGTVLRLHVRQGDPPTCSSTSPTCVSPWNHTWWMLEPPAPSSLVQQLS